MGTEVVRKLLSNIPAEHRVSDDARLEWLWHQRMAVVQKIFTDTNNVRDRMAATLVLSSTLLPNLASIELLLQRLEGGAAQDVVVQEEDSLPI